MSDTSTGTVERLAEVLEYEARYTDTAAAVGDHITVAYGNQCRQSAATMRDLAAERDAALRRAEKAEAERDALREALREIKRHTEGWRRVVIGSDAHIAETARAALGTDGESHD